VPIKSRRKRQFNFEYTTYRLLKIFFVMYSYNQLRQIMFKAKLQNGVFEHNFIEIIESKLPSYLYRSSLFPTIFESLTFVKQSNV
jgi:ribosomal protein S4